MAKGTLFFALLLILLGVGGYLVTGGVHPTALIPSYFGLALALFGTLAIASASRRRFFMHINESIGLLGFLGGVAEAVRGYVHALSAGLEPDRIALVSKGTFAGLLLIYLLLCLRSFVNARLAGKV